MIVGLNALFTEHFVWLEFNAESLGERVVGVIFPFLRKQRLSELTLTGAHLVSPSGAEAGG